MLDDDAILDSPVVYSPAEIMEEFQESCLAEADKPGRYSDRLKKAAEDLCQTLLRATLK